MKALGRVPGKCFRGPQARSKHRLCHLSIARIYGHHEGSRVEHDPHNAWGAPNLGARADMACPMFGSRWRALKALGGVPSKCFRGPQARSERRTCHLMALGLMVMQRGYPCRVSNMMMRGARHLSARAENMACLMFGSRLRALEALGGVPGKLFRGPHARSKHRTWHLMVRSEGQCRASS